MSKSTVELVEENWAKIAAELDLDADEAPEWRSWDESYFESASTEWRVGTDEEADGFAREYIEQSLWAFVPSFLAGTTGMDQSVFDALAKAELCEGANEAVEALINSSCGMDHFVEEAVSADGRGHFVSQYDGEEREVDVDGTLLYFYRTN